MHILLVDDEVLARQRLSKLLSQLEGYEIVGEVDNGEKAIAAVENLDPDLVLMDVKMPGVDGIDAARAIAEMEDPPAIIFCTAYDDYALEAFDAQAVGYIVKPVNIEKLQQALEKAQRVNKAQRAAMGESKSDDSKRKNISAKTRKGIELIPIDDIFCFIADQKYVTVVHSGGETLIDETLKELETELAPDFLRVHRNALVAIRNIIGMQKGDSGQFELVLKDSEYRPMVSRRHHAAVKSMINSL